MRIPSTILHTALLCGAAALAASGAEWRGRRIYQVMTDRFARGGEGWTTTTTAAAAACAAAAGEWCGGTWAGLAGRLDYIADMGFDAVWISPVTRQLRGRTVDGAAYHAYWQTDIESLESRFGTERDLKGLAAELHARGMFLMVDVVVNHFAWAGAPESVEYGTFVPFGSREDFHPYCVNRYDANDTTNLEQCWMGSTSVPLPDLRTEDAGVQSRWNAWAARMVSEYGIDGWRIDSVMEVNPGFWPSFQSAAGVYSLGEAYHADSEVVCRYQDYLPGVFNYPMYFPLVAAFSSASGSMSDLADMINVIGAGGACADPSLLGTFSENHDQPRFASLTRDLSRAKNVLTFTLLGDGIPVVYQGQEQHLRGGATPANREALWLTGYDRGAPLYGVVRRLNAVRALATARDGGYLTAANRPVYSDGHALAMRKGDVLTVLTNVGAAARGQAPLRLPATGYPAGTRLTELNGCTPHVVGENGTLAVPMARGLPRVFFPTADLGSGLCGVSGREEKRETWKTRSVGWRG